MQTFDDSIFYLEYKTRCAFLVIGLKISKFLQSKNSTKISSNCKKFKFFSHI